MPQVRAGERLEKEEQKSEDAPRRWRLELRHGQDDGDAQVEG